MKSYWLVCVDQGVKLLGGISARNVDDVAM